MSSRPRIPQPCPASWEQMTPVASGRYCGSCEKVVVDFTRMSEVEVLAWLSRHGRSCGRFRPDQLADAPAPRSWAAWLAAGAVALSACEVPAPEQVKLRTPPLVQTTDVVVRGQVTDRETGLPVAGAYITSLADSTVQARSDAAGRFVLQVPQHMRDSLLYVAASTASSTYIGKRVPLSADLRVALRQRASDVYALGESELALELEPGETMQPHALHAQVPAVRISTVQFLPPTSPKAKK